MEEEGEEIEKMGAENSRENSIGFWKKATKLIMNVNNKKSLNACANE